jgi:hypothetical protein
MSLHVKVLDRTANGNIPYAYRVLLENPDGAAA